MRRFIALAASAAAVAGTFAMTAPANAAPAECGSEGNPALGIVPVSAGGKTFYIDDRNFALGNGLWIYEESNGKGGLQRNAGDGSAAPVVGKTLSDNPVATSKEICEDLQGASKADTLYF